jgi:hypothetical protein
MESSLNIKKILITIVILVVLVFALSLGRRSQSDQNELTGNLDDSSAIVMVENTPVVDGVISVPDGFPPDIPLEKDKILESSTTRYPKQSLRQLSVSYQSLEPVAQKYMEYKNYMGLAGYSLKEEEPIAPTKVISGTKGDSNLSVVISNSGGRTLVQLSYLSK